METIAIILGVGAIPAVSDLLGRICGPMASEVSADLKRWYLGFRMRNIDACVAAALHIDPSIGDTKFAHPRIFHEFVERGSLVDDPTLQRAWGGLLAASCTEDGKDQSNLVFTNLISQMTGVQAKILDHLFTHRREAIRWADKMIESIHNIRVSSSELTDATGVTDTDRLDIEIDHMKALGLIQGGYHSTDRTQATFRVFNLAVVLYVRCQGSRKTPFKYFNENPDSIHFEGAK